MSPTFPFFLPCSLDLRITIHWNVDLVFFKQSWHIWWCWKIARTTFQCMVVFQSTGQNLILVKILWSKDLRVEHIFLVRVSLGAKSVLQQAAISLVCDVIVCSLFLGPHLNLNKHWFLGVIYLVKLVTKDGCNQRQRKVGCVDFL